MAKRGADIVAGTVPSTAANAGTNLKTYVTSLNEYIQQVYPTGGVGAGAPPAKDPNGEELMAALVAIQGDKEVQKLVDKTANDLLSVLKSILGNRPANFVVPTYKSSLLFGGGGRRGRGRRSGGSRSRRSGRK
jgi:hypothetical protein